MSDDMRKAFDTCDLDGKGTICAKELGAVLKALGEDESMAAIIIKAVDKNDDGVLTFDEFKAGLESAKA